MNKEQTKYIYYISKNLEELATILGDFTLEAQQEKVFREEFFQWFDLSDFEGENFLYEITVKPIRKLTFKPIRKLTFKEKTKANIPKEKQYKVYTKLDDDTVTEITVQDI